MLPPLTEKNKPVVQRPVDSNVFAVIGSARRALKRQYANHAKEMCDRAFAAKSYDEVLAIVQEYVSFDLGET